MSARISVIVRTLGRDTLARCLASVDAQARDDVVVVLVDARGGAPVAVDTRTPVQRVHAGRPLTRTPAAAAGLAAVQTRWALFLDDDDELLPGHLDKLAGALTSRPDAVLAHTGVALQDAEGQPRGAFDRAFIPGEMLLGNQLPIHAVLFDAVRLREAGVAFDESLPVYEDWDFWLQALAVGPAVHVPGCSAIYHLAGTGSEVHALPPGDVAHWRIWRKWWARAPESWWTEAFQEGQAAATLRLHLRQARDEVAVVQGHLEQTREAVQALKAGLDGAQAQIATHLQSLQSMQATEVALRHALWAAEVERDRLRGRAELAEAQRDALQVKHLELQELADDRLRLLRQSQALLQAEAMDRRRLAEQIRALQASTSWRWTAPLRAAVTAVRDAKRRLGAWRRQSRWRSALQPQGDYQRWQQTVEAVRWPSAAAPAAVQGSTSDPRAEETPLFSVVVPVCEPDLALLDAALDSAAGLGPGDWELCVADDASVAVDVSAHLKARAARDPRLRWTQRTERGHIGACTQSALALARGRWVLFLDQDDLLAPHVGAALREALQRHPEAQVLFSDEDKLDPQGCRFEPHFKASFSLEALRAQNGLSHLTAVRREALQAVGGLREGFDGAQDHDLLLRLAERWPATAFVHVPAVLYHWRVSAGSTAAAGAAKGYALQAAQRSVQDHLSRTAPGAQVEALAGTGWLRVRHALPQPLPRVSVWRDDATASGPQASALPGVLPVTLGDDGQSPWVLHLASGVDLQDASALEELLALASQPDVGVVAGAVFQEGVLAAGALEPDAEGRPQVWAAGVAQGAPGPFGRALIPRDATAVDLSAALLRRELWPVWQRLAAFPPEERALQFAQAVRAAGWRVLWTPFAPFERHRHGFGRADS
jgi:glycosyltransferase involved in cell wall biosynthesis